MRRLLVPVLVAIVGCGEPSGDPSGDAQPDARADGGFLPMDAGCMSLGADDAREFTLYAVGVRSSQVPCTRDAINAARGDEAVLDQLLDYLGEQWTVDTVRDESIVVTILEILKQLGPATRAQVLNDFVWRTGSISNDSLILVEMNTAEALACIPTDEARALVQDIVSRHPFGAVRSAAADMVKDQYCLFLQPGIP